MTSIWHIFKVTSSDKDLRSNKIAIECKQCVLNRMLAGCGVFNFFTFEAEHVLKVVLKLWWNLRLNVLMNFVLKKKKECIWHSFKVTNSDRDSRSNKIAIECKQKGGVFLTECWQAAVFLICLTFEAGHVLKVVLKLW